MSTSYYYCQYFLLLLCVIRDSD